MLRIDQLFYRGAYQELLAGVLETPDAVWPRERAHYLVGALVFVGRVDDALVMHKRYAGGLGASGLAAARFFLGIGLTRVSRYEEAARFFQENLLLVRRRVFEEDPVARFYAWQGIGFYRYFQNRHVKAQEAAKKAWEAALEGDYAYGQSLAVDLRGHALVRSGMVAAGLKALDDAARLCERFGLGAQGHVVRTALFGYKAVHGLLETETIPALESFIAETSPEDNFTRASLQTVLAHQLSIRGRVRESEALLAEAARVILKAGHRRHKAMVLHKLAHNRYYMARLDESLDLLAKAEREIDVRFDIDYLLQIEGLRLKIARRRGLEEPERAARVAKLTWRTGLGIGRNVLWRETGAGKPTLPGDDLLGDLRHRARAGGGSLYADVLKIIDERHYGFLHEVVPGAAGGRAVCFDLVPQRITVFDDGDVTIAEEPVSAMLKAVALHIARQPATKQDLIEGHWGFVYHALRHDTLVYAVINRLRAAMGKAGEWLLHEGGRYQWVEGVRVFAYEAQGMPEVRNDAKKVVWESAESPVEGLNSRQLAILSELQRRTYVNVQDCIKLFGISRITAFRDLSELEERGFVHKVGKGRATAYHRAQS